LGTFYTAETSLVIPGEEKDRLELHSTGFITGDMPAELLEAYPVKKNIFISRLATGHFMVLPQMDTNSHRFFDL